MKSDLVIIDNHGKGFAEALDQTRRTGIYRDLPRKEQMRLQLIAEEMLSMASSLTGSTEATFWIESEGKAFEVNMTTQTVMDMEKRRELLASATTRKNAAAQGFLGRLRDAFEEAMTAQADAPVFELPTETQADLTGREYASSSEWDKYERSVLFRLADNLKVGIRGGLVSVTVSKDFGRAG